MHENFTIVPVPSRVAAIEHANKLAVTRALVVCGAANRLVWAPAIRAHTTMPGRPLIYPILREGHGVHPNAHWTIISYALCKSMAINKLLRNHRYGLIILDDADHHLQNPDTLRTRVILGAHGLIALAPAIAQVCHDEFERVASIENLIERTRQREKAEANG